MNLKKMNKLINWFKKSFEEENGKPSAKRKTLFAMVLMLGYVVARYTDHSNSVSMATALIGAILTLAGVAAYQSVKKTNTPKNDNL